MDVKSLDSNVFFTMISFAIFGLCGVLINTFIIKNYNAELLGRFNLLLTFLLIVTQFTVGGVHLSVLKYNTHFHANKKLSANVVTSGLFIVVILSLLTIFLLFKLSDVIVKQFNIKNFKYQFLTMLPAILFFSLNKVLLMGLNGLNNIKAYAFFNATRYILLLFYLVFFYLDSISEKYLGSIFSISELTIFVILIIYFFYYIENFKLPDFYWIKTHISFGFRGLCGGALMETNTKIDLIMIGYILNDKAIGIYSFASMIAEGFSMLYFVLRNNIDPVIGNAFFNKKKDLILRTIRNVRKRYVPFILLFGIVLIMFYPIIFETVFRINKNIISQSWQIIIILIGFNLISSFFQPFIGLLNLAGKPEFFSAIILFTIIINIILNYILIPVFNIKGAAFATGIVFTIQSIMLYFTGKKFILK